MNNNNETQRFDDACTTFITDDHLPGNIYDKLRKRLHEEDGITHYSKSQL